MNRKSLHVLKFGSSVLTKAADIPKAVKEISQYCQQGSHVFVVVSALGNTTDDLIEAVNLYKQFDQQAIDDAAYARVLATCEKTTVALLNLALTQAGIQSTALDQDYLLTRGEVTESEPSSLNQIQIQKAFKNSDVVIVPGFLGINENGIGTLLGRGGSDLSAVYCAWALQANSCSLIKDVNGVYNLDPNKYGDEAKLFQTLTFDDANEISGKLIQKRALLFAQQKNLTFNVRSLGNVAGTLVGEQYTSYKPNNNHQISEQLTTEYSISA